MAAALLTLRYAGNSGRIQAVSGYANDTTNNLVRFDESKIAVAGSSDFFTVKENGFIVDICLTSDLATPTHIQVLRNGTPTGDVLDATANLASVTTRPQPRIPFVSGDKIQLMQIA